LVRHCERSEANHEATIEQTGITADTALRLSKAFGTTAQMWLNLQNSYDMRVAQQQIGKELAGIERIEPNKAA
jgi:addiction module HigA family antidote